MHDGHQSRLNTNQPHRSQSWNGRSETTQVPIDTVLDPRLESPRLINPPGAQDSADHRLYAFLDSWNRPTPGPTDPELRRFAAAHYRSGLTPALPATYDPSRVENGFPNSERWLSQPSPTDPDVQRNFTSQLDERATQQNDLFAAQNVTQSGRPHPNTRQTDYRLPSLPQTPRTALYAGHSTFELPPEFPPFSPSIMNFMNFSKPQTPVSPLLTSTSSRSGSRRNLFSVQQLRQIRQLWHGQRSAPSVQLGRCVWGTVVKHSADNIFSVQATNSPAYNALSPTGKWRLDEQTRKELMIFCMELDETVNQVERIDSGPVSAHSATPESLASAATLPSLSVDGFPTLEALEASLDIYFQYFPFALVHKATFDPKTTSRTILFPMCLIGLASLYAERSKQFVVRYLQKMMRFCRADLTSKALGHGDPYELLATITSTLLVSYLALGFLEEVDHSQAHMLCSQLLHVAGKHGLFTTALGENVSSLLDNLPAGSEALWKAWARVESCKRVIVYLLLLDSAYTRLQGAAGVVDIDKVEIALPCDATMFDAPTFARFEELRKEKKLVMPTISLRDFASSAPSAADPLSLQTILTLFYLRVSGARHRLSSAITQPHSPAEAFARQSNNEEWLRAIALLPRTYPQMLQNGDTMCALAWNNLGLSLTADMDLLEIASGRKGLDAAQEATELVGKWSSTASARRSVLHAAQLFRVLSSSRLKESNIARSDLLLFTSALVLSMYLFVVESQQPTEHQALELLDQVDWVAVEGEGILGGEASTQHSDSTAVRFIRHGGPVSFDGEVLDAGAHTARRILTSYVHLLDELGKWRNSRYSQLLRIMSDFAIEGPGSND